LPIYYGDLVNGYVNINNVVAAPLIAGSTRIETALVSAYSTMTFEVIGNITNAASGLTGTVRLYNVTTGTTAATLSITSESSSLVSSGSLSVPVVNTQYEAQVYISDNSSNSNRLIINMARLKFS
jgi:hypothetical protein